MIAVTPIQWMYDNMPKEKSVTNYYNYYTNIRDMEINKFLCYNPECYYIIILNQNKIKLYKNISEICELPEIPLCQSEEELVENLTSLNMFFTTLYIGQFPYHKLLVFDEDLISITNILRRDDFISRNHKECEKQNIAHCLIKNMLIEKVNFKLPNGLNKERYVTIITTSAICRDTSQIFDWTFINFVVEIAPTGKFNQNKNAQFRFYSNIHEDIDNDVIPKLAIIKESVNKFIDEINNDLKFK